MDTVQNQDLSAFHLIPGGKPNPWDHSLARVVRKAQKGPTCLFHALKILLDNRAPIKSEVSARREFEICFSR